MREMKLIKREISQRNSQDSCNPGGIELRLKAEANKDGQRCVELRRQKIYGVGGPYVKAGLQRVS